MLVEINSKQFSKSSSRLVAYSSNEDTSHKRLFIELSLAQYVTHLYLAQIFSTSIIVRYRSKASQKAMVTKDVSRQSPAPEEKKKEEKKKDAKEEKQVEMVNRVDLLVCSLSVQSEEDKKLQEDLNLLVERLSEPNAELYQPSLETMRSLIRASTTSMTSVPKPLKFMRPHYAKMKEIFDKIKEGPVKVTHAFQ